MSNEFKDWLSDFNGDQKKNYELCMKYPIIIPRHRRTGKVRDDYMYEYTELDRMPRGWRIAFGEQWAAEIQAEIDKLPEDFGDKVHIDDLRDKNGRFIQEFNYYTNKIDAIIKKYARLSASTCIRCGSPATKISCRPIRPWCDACADMMPYRMTSLRWIKEDENGDS